MDYNNCTVIIKKLRITKLYTQQQVSEFLSIGQKTYSDYELGYTRIPIESIIKLAMLYDVDMNYITGVSSIVNSFPKK